MSGRVAGVVLASFFLMSCDERAIPLDTIPIDGGPDDCEAELEECLSQCDGDERCETRCSSLCDDEREDEDEKRRWEDCKECLRECGRNEACEDLCRSLCYE